MTTIQPGQETFLDLKGLRGLKNFVTLTSIDDLARDVRRAGRYFRAFGPEDDATLLIYAVTEDPHWAAALVEDTILAGGATVDTCTDVKLCVVDDDPATIEPLLRRSHAVLSEEDTSWLNWPRPVYGWEALPALREQAERFWGRREATAPYSYEAAIEYLVDREWTTEIHARDGSVPESSLATMVETFEAHLPSSGPRILHVGNFLGVSLSYLLNWAAPRDGIVVSVDADIPHRGVEHPQRATNDLLSHFGLTHRHMLVCGYSLEKCLSNDSVVYEGYDPASSWTQEAAPENSLPMLADLGHRFDAALIDGNHEPGYLRREVEQIERMLTPGGLLVLDDVSDMWAQIGAVFVEVVDGDWPFAPVQADGRIGVLRKL